MNELRLPLSEQEIRRLRAGTWFSLSGTLITARDSAHQFLCRQDPPEFRELLRNAFIYHCGPIATRRGEGWSWVAAGPTTSSRMEPYTPALIERYQIKGIIGKGGMGAGTQQACRKFGCVYCQAPGGCAALLARRVVRVEGVYKLEEFGIPEAVWVVQVEKFPLLVTMDSHGNNLYQQIKQESQKQQLKLQESAAC